MNINVRWVISAGSIAFVLLLFARFVLPHVTKREAPPPPPKEEFNYKPSCGRVTAKCIAEVSLRQLKCNKRKAERELREQLNTPLQTEGCKEAESKLSNTCSSGCSLDGESISLITGKAEVLFAEIAGEKGCLATGSRPLTISGVCRPD